MGEKKRNILEQNTETSNNGCLQVRNLLGIMAGGHGKKTFIEHPGIFSIF